MLSRRFVAFDVVAVTVLSVSLSLAQGKPWPRHTIDDSSRGADGTRLLDVNNDGLLDIATGWEQGGIIRIYLHPGPVKARQKWPAVTVGEVGSPEDAVFVDLDGDGAVDVVSSCEGKVRTIFVHWADKDRYLDPAGWKTESIPVTIGTGSWMFCLPMQIDGYRGIDLVAGSKGGSAQIGWLESPKNPRNLADWKWHPIEKAGWIMSLEKIDMDGDGDLDIVASDRKGERHGSLWLENPGPTGNPTHRWNRHRFGVGEKEVMFLDVVDLDRDGMIDLLVPTRQREILFHRSKSNMPLEWETFPIEFPQGTGTPKSVKVGDIDLDGKPDIVFSCENSQGCSGVMWMSFRQQVTDPIWDAHEISGPVGTKFDLVQLIDMDTDGDLDVLTCEERENLGVIWYENGKNE